VVSWAESGVFDLLGGGKLNGLSTTCELVVLAEDCGVTDVVDDTEDGLTGSSFVENHISSLA
jgi:hypothetical protein